MSEAFVNQLHYGDNLVRLRKHIPDEVADLIYLDPPFNSQRNYNLLFKQQKGQESPAQIMAFEDTWQWSPLAYEEFKGDERNQPLWKLVDSLYAILGSSEMMAYVVMMAPRLLELHNKLKPTGSLFLHCDPSASHYLRIILDVVFRPDRFVNEIVWKRTTAHGDAKQGSKHFGRIHDTLLFYVKGEGAKWLPQFTPYEKEYVDTYYKYIDSDGRRYWRDNLTAAKPGGDTKYEWRVKRQAGKSAWQVDATGEFQKPIEGWEYKGVAPPASRYWAYSREKMLKMADEGRIVYSSSGTPMYKRYLDEMKGRPVQDIWDDIRGLGGLGSNAKERRGYPTQKPLALLERIIAASTHEGDVVLDPFAGCGTAIVAAERMNRRWIGIDITYLAINEVVDRLTSETGAYLVDAAGKPRSTRKPGEARTSPYRLMGTPKDEDAARALFSSTADQNHRPFEQWAVTLVGGKWNDKKGADRGVDGRIGLWDMQGNHREALIQIKGGNALSLSVVRDFGRTIEREKAVCGILIAQREPTKEMIQEAETMGYADWPGSRKIARMQIVTTKGILERGDKPILPESWLVGAQKGIGKATGSQEAIDFSES